MSLDKMARVYGMVKHGQRPVKSKISYPYEYLKDENIYDSIINEAEVDDFNSNKQVNN